jgi:BspA type Leucine rich repeat region (6 copies)
MKTAYRLSIAALGLAFCNFCTSAFAQAQFSYMINNGAVTITGYNGPGGEVVIPSTIGDLPVVGIRNKAFDHRTTVTSVAIPEGITNIGNNAFYHCTALRKVTIPGSAGNLGGWMFSSCSSLTNATIGNGVVSIGLWEFFWCTSLTHVSIPDSVTSIGYGAFYHCSSLTTVTVGKNVASLGPSAFADCTNLKGIYFTGNAPTADDSVFVGAGNAIVYFLPGTVGWGSTFAGRPTAPWPVLNPVILSRGPAGGYGMTVYWPTNGSVVVEACTNLTLPTWVGVSTNRLTNGSLDFSDPKQTNYPARFYRIRSL